MSAVLDKILLIRDKDRISPLQIMENIFTDFIEFHGDRKFADDCAVVAGIAYFNDMPVTVIAINKGKTTAEKIKNNFGSPHPEGYRKALRLMQQAEKFNRPVICLIDTAGAYCGIGAEERGQGVAIAENITKMLGLKVPTVSIITGEGGSGGALALATSDKVFMLENSMYSVISPEGCASILWKDAARIEEAATSLKLFSNDLFRLGFCDKVIQEDNLFENLKKTIEEALDELMGLKVDKMLEIRYDKYRSAGAKCLI